MSHPISVADKSKQQSINSKTQRKHSASLAAKVMTPNFNYLSLQYQT